MKFIDPANRAKLNAILPSTDYLFSDKVSAVADALQKSTAFNPLAINYRSQRGASWTRGSFRGKTRGFSPGAGGFSHYSSGGFRGGRGGKPRGRGRGGPSRGGPAARGKKLQKFAEA